MGRTVRTVLVANKFHFVAGGAEVYYLSVIELLRRRGLDVVPFSIDYDGTLPGDHRRYFIDPPCRVREPRILRQKHGTLDKLRLATRAVWNSKVSGAIERIHRERRPDVAYLLNINNHLSPSIIAACAKLRIPVVMRLSDFNLVCASNMYFRDGRPCTECRHGLHHAVRHRCVGGSFAASLAATFAMSVHRWLKVYAKIDAFIAPSDCMRRELQGLGFPVDRVHHVPTFVAMRDAVRPAADPPYVLFAGRFKDYKGPELAIEAFAGLRGQNGAVRLLLIGDEGDDYACRLRDRVRESGNSAIHILPFEHDREAMAGVIGRALVNLVPSRFYENSPNVLLESFACGRPVVAARIGSLPEVVRDGENGLLFAPGDVGEFSHAIGTMLKSESERERMGRNARETALRGHSGRAHLDALLSVFESAASNPNIDG